MNLLNKLANVSEAGEYDSWIPNNDMRFAACLGASTRAQTRMFADSRRSHARVEYLEVLEQLLAHLLQQHVVVTLKCQPRLSIRLQ